MTDGRPIGKPSVTELLPEQRFYCTPEQLENARIEGTVNHEMIKTYFDTGETFGDQYLEEFAEFWDLHKVKFGNIVCYEKRLESELFHGKPDIVCTKAIIDIKRSRGDKKFQALQLAGYSILVSELLSWHIDNWYIIFRDTKFRLKEVDIDKTLARGTFMALVSRYYAEKKINEYMGVK